MCAAKCYNPQKRLEGALLKLRDADTPMAEFATLLRSTAPLPYHLPRIILDQHNSIRVASKEDARELFACARTLELLPPSSERDTALAWARSHSGFNASLERDDATLWVCELWQDIFAPRIIQGTWENTLMVSDYARKCLGQRQRLNEVELANGTIELERVFYDVVSSSELDVKWTAHLREICMPLTNVIRAVCETDEQRSMAEKICRNVIERVDGLYTDYTRARAALRSRRRDSESFALVDLADAQVRNLFEKTAHDAVAACSLDPVHVKAALLECVDDAASRMESRVRRKLYAQAKRGVTSNSDRKRLWQDLRLPGSSLVARELLHVAVARTIVTNRCCPPMSFIAQTGRGVNCANVKKRLEQALKECFPEKCPDKASATRECCRAFATWTLKRLGVHVESGSVTRAEAARWMSMASHAQIEDAVDTWCARSSDFARGSATSLVEQFVLRFLHQCGLSETRLGQIASALLA